MEKLSRRRKLSSLEPSEPVITFILSSANFFHAFHFVTSNDQRNDLFYEQIWGFEFFPNLCRP